MLTRQQKIAKTRAEKADRARQDALNELANMVEKCRTLLISTWSNRQSDDEYLVLGDMVRPDVLTQVVAQQGTDYDHVLITYPEKFAFSVLAAYLEPSDFPDRMASTGKPGLVEAGDFMRVKHPSSEYQPLLFLHSMGSWATSWGPNLIWFGHGFEYIGEEVMNS